MIRYASELTDFPRWARGLGQILLPHPLGGTKCISPSPGMTWLRTGHLYSGISYMIVDISLQDDLTVILRPSTSPGLLLDFNVGTCNPTLRLLSTGNFYEVTYGKNNGIRNIGILATGSFLRHHLLKPILADLFRRANLSPSPYPVPVPFDHRPLLEDLLGPGPGTPLHRLHVHNRLLLLAEKFLFSCIDNAPQPSLGSLNWARAKEKDIAALREIMNVLSTDGLRKFPSIELLSKSAMMSSTKLKTRFKQIYGRKLYEVYNRHRLLQAREMLRTGDYSIKQVGVNIGFSNLSNFAKAFKKEFGVLPRDILKRK